MSPKRKAKWHFTRKTFFKAAMVAVLICLLAKLIGRELTLIGVTYKAIDVFGEIIVEHLIEWGA